MEEFANDTYVARVNGSVVLPCFTSFDIGVAWYFQESVSSPARDIFPDGSLVDKSGRFFVHPDGKGNVSLEINNVQTEDSGLYTCQEIEGQGTKHRRVLFVREYSLVFSV